MTKAASRQRQLVLSAGQGRVLSGLGVATTLKAGPAETGGAFGVVEATLPPHFRAGPPHWHRHLIEAFYVLDGTLAFTLDDQTMTVSHGGFVLMPPRIVHTFWNPTAAPVTYLALFTPASYTELLEELAAAFTRGPLDMQRLAEIAAQHDQIPPPVQP